MRNLKKEIAILDRVIAHFGSQKKLAHAIGIQQPSIMDWKERGIPAARVLQIERRSGGKFTRSELRPDIYPEEEK